MSCAYTKTFPSLNIYAFLRANLHWYLQINIRAVCVTAGLMNRDCLWAVACFWSSAAVHRNHVLDELAKITCFSYKNKIVREPFLWSALMLKGKYLLQNLWTPVSKRMWHTRGGTGSKVCEVSDMAFFLSPSLSLNLVLSAKDKMQREFMTNRLSLVNHCFFFCPVFELVRYHGPISADCCSENSAFLSPW